MSVNYNYLLPIYVYLALSVSSPDGFGIALMSKTGEKKYTNITFMMTSFPITNDAEI